MQVAIIKHTIVNTASTLFVVALEHKEQGFNYDVWNLSGNFDKAVYLL